MKKIPTVFERDWNGDRSRVLDQVHPGCEWVLAGEGVATRKVDGTCCMIRNGVLYKRREIVEGDRIPAGYEQIDMDETTGKAVGWVPVGDGPEDRWHREAFAHLPPVDGTYELVGPKVQGNPEGFEVHYLYAHSEAEKLLDVPRTFYGLQDWLRGQRIEGIVFHHPDGRMAKIKLRDFGLRRVK